MTPMATGESRRRCTTPAPAARLTGSDHLRIFLLLQTGQFGVNGCSTAPGSCSPLVSFASNIAAAEAAKRTAGSRDFSGRQETAGSTRAVCVLSHTCSRSELLLMSEKTVMPPRMDIPTTNRMRRIRSDDLSKMDTEFLSVPSARSGEGRESTMCDSRARIRPSRRRVAQSGSRAAWQRPN